METIAFKKKIRAFAILAFSFVGLGIFICFGIYSPANSRSNKTVVFVVQKGEGSHEISSQLQKQRLIRSAFVFRIFTIVSRTSNKLQAGAYQLSPSMSAQDIAKKIAKGDVIREFVIIPEGYSVNDIATLFEKQGIFSANDFIKIAKPFEGYLFPDTYHITRIQTIQDVVDQMRKNFDQHVTQNIRSEVVVMASIIEKEVQTLQDKKIVSGILWKRVANKMPLQVDAAPETYQNSGLPLSPIANPGFESIQSALYPTPSPYWFYLSTKVGPRGEASKTIFSRTLEKHNIAKTKYLK